VFVYGTIKSAISFKGADQSWTKISVGLLLLAFIVAQRVIVVRSQRTRRQGVGVNGSPVRAARE
jgi:simple sugar transport system permease protein